MNKKALLIALPFVLCLGTSFTSIPFAVAQPEESEQQMQIGYPVSRNTNTPTTTFAHKRISDVTPILIGGSKLYFKSEDERICFMNQVVDPQDPQRLTWSYYFDLLPNGQVSYPLHSCTEIQ